MAVPKLRFKEFDGDWSPYVLKDFVSFRKGKGISKADISEDGINECIRYGELYTTYGQVITKVQSKTHVSKSECVLSQAGDVLIPASGETQIDIATASCVLKEDVILSGDLNILSHKENGEWLAYYLSSAKKLDIAQLAQGNSVVHLYSSQLKDLKINKPSKAEQTKIASFLSAVDEKISQLTQKHELLNQYKQGMMQKLFSQHIRFKADDGSEFEEWDEKILSELFDYANGKSFEAEVIENGSFKLITLNSIDIKGNLKNSHKTISQGDNSLLRNDLIMILSDVAHGNFLGLTAIIPDNSFVLNQRVGRLRSKTDINICYMRFYINFNQKYFKLNGQGSSQLNLSKGDVLSFPVNLPCLEEQTKIANFLSAIDQKIEVVTQQIEQAKTWKKGLLQQMFV